MRLVVVMAVVCLAACASEKLVQAPPAGVDFSGRWKLNEADSDDPQRLIQAQFNAPPAGQSGAPGGRSGRQGGRGGGPNLGGPLGPVMPPVSVLNEGLRWPGKQLDIKQVAGVVAFTSGGINRICQPLDGGRAHRHHADGAHRGGDSPGGDTRAQRREPPPRCGWTDKTLIVQSSDPDDDRPPFEEHYSLSEDSQRLVEVVEFTGGRSSGYTMSRVWDRSSQ
jgi:hypothetical protein